MAASVAAVKVTRFDARADLIIVGARVWGSHPSRLRKLRLVLDTGAAETIITPDVLDELGYSARDAERRTVIRSAVAEEHGYILRVARFACLGFEAASFRVDAHDLPEGWEIDGLLGLRFLRQFNYEVRSAEGRIRVERLAQ